MTAFRVQCETCQSWLKVRDEGFVGEVHACPKCGSMVLIAAPTAAPTTAAPVTAAPIVAVMSDTLEATEAPAEGFAAPPPLPEPEPVVEGASSAGFPWVMVTAASGVALTGIATVAYFLWPGVETPEPPTQPVVAEAKAPEAEPTPPLVEESPQVDTPAEEVAANEAPIDSQVAVETPAASIEEDKPETLTLPPDTPANEPTAAEEKPTERVALANASPSEDAPKPDEPPAEIDPLAIDFDEVEVVLRKGPTSEPVDSPPVKEPQTPTLTAPSEPTLDDELAEAAQHAGVFVRRGPTNEANGPFTGSSLAALAYVAPAVNLNDIPLDEAMQVVGGVAGAPITIDPVSLRLAGVSANKPISLVGEDVTLSDLLASSLKPLRLGVVTEGPYATVVRLEADEVRTINHPIGDLIANDEAGLINLLKIVGKLPDDTQIIDSKLAVTAPLATQYDLVVLCERLRLARKLPLKTKYPPSLLSAEPSLVTLAPMLDRRTTFSFVEPTPLADVFAHWRRVTGLSILVDWRALADIGYGPRSTIECSVTNRPWRAALDGVLGGLGLTWGAIDGHTLWLTTRDAAQQPETVEFYPAGTMAPAGAVAEVDPVSGRVLVRAMAIEQRKIAEDSAVPATAGLE